MTKELIDRAIELDEQRKRQKEIVNTYKSRYEKAVTHLEWLEKEFKQNAAKLAKIKNN